MYVPQILILLLLYLLEAEKENFLQTLFQLCIHYSFYAKEPSVGISKCVWWNGTISGSKSVYTYVVLSHLVCERHTQLLLLWVSIYSKTLIKYNDITLKAFLGGAVHGQEAAFSPHRHYMLIRSPTYNHLNAHKKYLCLTYYRQLSLFFFDHSNAW